MFVHYITLFTYATVSKRKLCCDSQLEMTFNKVRAVECCDVQLEMTFNKMSVVECCDVQLEMTSNKVRAVECCDVQLEMMLNKVKTEVSAVSFIHHSINSHIHIVNNRELQVLISINKLESKQLFLHI